jgi:predicted RNA-binding protein Jag
LEEVETAKEMLFELIKRMGVEPEIRGSLKERSICLEVKGGREEILIGKHGCTLEAPLKPLRLSSIGWLTIG